MKFQDKFYDIIHHNNCPSSEKSAEKCILRNSYFHHSEPIYGPRTFCDSVVSDKYNRGIGGSVTGGAVYVER